MIEPLTPDEQELLRGIIEEYLADLRMEIRETDSYDFRMTLKQKEETLRQILRKVQPATTGPTPEA